MRVLRSAAVAAAFLGAPFAASADVAGFGVGGYLWSATPTGWFEDEGTRYDLEDEFQLDSNNAFSVWAALEHPVPIIPNLKLAYTPLSFEGSGTVNFTFEGFNFNEDVDTTVELNQLDAILYYELLDDGLNLDIGVNFKVLDALFEVAGQTSGQTEQLEFSAPIPMLYVNASVDLPLTGLSIGVEGSAVGYSGNQLLDAKAGIGYTFAAIATIEAGYRVLQLKLEDIDDVNADIRIAGPYVGAYVDF